MICAECLMRWWLAVMSATGREPEIEQGLIAGTAPVAHAVTIHQGHALCIEHHIECVKVQVASSIVGPNGAPMVMPPSAQNGARRG